jgi:KaiC/GvpD/RAD55 family RecA-like ATPase
MIEFPQTYSALLHGLPGVGKSEYCMELVKGYLEKGEKVVYVTTEKSPVAVRKRMKELGVDLDIHEGKSFLFIDVFTRSAGTKEEKVLYVENPSNLNLVSVRLSEASAALGKSVRIIFDSLSTFFLHASEGEIRSFFESINTKISTDHGFVLFTLHDEMHDEKVVVALKSMVLSVLEMEIGDAPSRKRMFRVTFAKQGVSYSPDWSEFKITKEGLEFSPVEEAEAKRKLPLVKVAGVVVVLLLGMGIFWGMFGGEEKTTSYDTVTPDPSTSSFEEHKLDGMEDVSNWFSSEGPDVILDITESTEFSKNGKSMKITVEVLGEEDAWADVNLPSPQLTGYDGITIWSYVPEPVPLGKIGLFIEEGDYSTYVYFDRMRSLKKTGWFKDTVHFSDLRLSSWEEPNNFDENGQLDLDQLDKLGINFGGGPGAKTGTYVIYLDELNLFKYNSTSE